MHAKFWLEPWRSPRWGASAKQRADWELIGGAIGIHWDAVDEDISVASLLQPENFMRLPRKRMSRSGISAGVMSRDSSRTGANEALQPTSRAQRRSSKKRGARAARGSFGTLARWACVKHGWLHFRIPAGGQKMG